MLGCALGAASQLPSKATVESFRAFVVNNHGKRGPFLGPAGEQRAKQSFPDTVESVGGRNCHVGDDERTSVPFPRGLDGQWHQEVVPPVGIGSKPVTVGEPHQPASLSGHSEPERGLIHEPREGAALGSQLLDWPAEWRA